jgi:phytoene dehydrogenase-like protein
VQPTFDVIVIGAGPNGLTAAALLAQQGLRVHVVEAAEALGGGVRSAALTLPGYVHDVCSAVHTMGCVSPVFARLKLEEHGLEWRYPTVSAAHPLDDGDAVLLHADLDETFRELGAKDGNRLRLLLQPFRSAPGLFGDLLGPLQLPKHPLALLRFGVFAMQSAVRLSRVFSGERAKALFAGCAAHAIQPLEHWFSSAIGLALLGAGSVKPWPVAVGGSQSVAKALIAVGKRANVTYQCGTKVNTLSDLPDARAYLFDLAPSQLADIAGDQLPSRFKAELRRYRMGPGVFKVDYALSGSIPWRDARCKLASTVHLGGTLENIARGEQQMWSGSVPDAPFVLLAQQSELDPSRAPVGKHTGYAYCHVPAHCDVDMTDVIERQIERHAPGFRDLVLARRVWSPRSLEDHNPSYIGGAITGGVADVGQLFTRPTLRLRPYATPNPRLFLCSQSTPPGGGVHGMCGFHAARTVLARAFGRAL